MRMLPIEAPSAEAVLAKAADENFTVASRLFPKSLRPHLMNVYGFARLADDIGDGQSALHFGCNTDRQTAPPGAEHGCGPVKS